MLKQNKLRTLLLAVSLQISFEIGCALDFEVLSPTEIAVTWPEGKLIEFELNVNRNVDRNSAVDFRANKSDIPTELRILKDNFNVRKGDVLWYSGVFVDNVGPYGEAGNYIFDGDYKPWHPPAGYRKPMPDLPLVKKLHKARRDVTEQSSEEQPKTAVIESRFGHDRRPKHRHGLPHGSFPPPGPPHNLFAPPPTPPPFGHGDWRDYKDQRRNFRDQWRDYRDQWRDHIDEWRDHRDQWRDHRHQWRGHGHHRDKSVEKGPWDGHGVDIDVPKNENGNGGNRLPGDGGRPENGSGVSSSETNLNFGTTPESVPIEPVTQRTTTTTTTDVPDIDIRFAEVEAV